MALRSGHAWHWAAAFLPAIAAFLVDKAADSVDLCAHDAALCGLQSSSGLLPIRHGNLFYWYFEPETPDPSAPLVLWLQGGPGASSMMGLFFEIGPLSLNSSAALVRRPDSESWARYPLLFIDQPVGTGWSTAAGPGDYAQNETAVAADLAEFLEKFAKLHPEAPSRLVLTGESYGGHYLPALGAYLLTHPGRFTVQGVAIGDGLTDPATQELTKPAAAFTFGLIDELLLAETQALAQEAHDAALAGHFRVAVEKRGKMEELVRNASGVNLYDVRTTSSYDWQDQRMQAFFDRQEVKELLHVPHDHRFGTVDEVDENLRNDVMRSQKHHVEALLSAGVRVLLYQGQFDWKDGVSSNEAWIRTMRWRGIPGYLAAPRAIWHRQQDGAVAGYWRRFENLEQVVVLGAGHLVPMDQPLSAVDMLRRFLAGPGAEGSTGPLVV